MTETIEDFLGELKTAIHTGECPYCKTALVTDFVSDGSEMLCCPKCSWACMFRGGFVP